VDHVGLVTPLRDGMNLVAKEYVAAQDEDDPGVLILSRFAGAAEDAVNPCDADEVVQALQRAINMPQAERRERHEALLTVSVNATRSTGERVSCIRSRHPGASWLSRGRHNNATVICCHSQEKEQPSRLFAARRSPFDV